jgi:hypothetical protein
MSNRRHQPVKIDAAFEAEAKAMALAMETGELPPRAAPYFDRVKRLAEAYWAAVNANRVGRA